MSTKNASPHAAQSGRPAQAQGLAGQAMDEEAHFRIDELERRAEAMEEAMDPTALQGFFAGAAATMRTELRTEIEKLVVAQRADVDTDREVVAELKQVCACLKDLCAALSAPAVRTSVVNLPSGPVQIQTRETRQ